MNKTILIFGAILLLYTGLNAYIGWSGYIWLRHLGVHVPVIVYGSGFVIVAYGYVLARISIPLVWLRKSLKWVGGMYFVIFEYAILLLPPIHVTVWLLKLAGIETARTVPLLGAFLLLVLAVIMLRGSWNAWQPVVRQHELRIHKAVSGLSKLRVAVASDLHLGDIVGRGHLSRLERQLEQLQPDIMLLPGDVLDDSAEPFMRERMYELLQRIRGKYGAFAVLGNHEYYGGEIKAYTEKMWDIGVPVLQDESILVADTFYIVGRKDKTAESMDPDGRLSVQQLLAELDRSKPIIMLDHQPVEIREAAQAGVDVLLCGHTHRGQFAPNHWVTSKLFELDWGTLRKGALHVIVSSGFGSWGPPVRIASRSELWDVTIHFDHNNVT